MNIAEIIDPDIREIRDSAMGEADKILKVAQSLIDDVRTVIKTGVDTLTVGQVEEWILVIPVMISEIAPVRDAYELTRKLYTIDCDQIEARTLLDTTEKGGRRDAIISINTRERETDKAIMYYVRDRAGNMIEALQSLLISLMKIYNSKMKEPKEN